MAYDLKRIYPGTHSEPSGKRARKELQLEDFTPHCPVHGLIHLPWIARVFVDTELFQRMRHIKQLGMQQFVYPGAKHDRFFHSIGTAYLAKQFVTELRHRQPELGATDRDILCVMLAGLCHDLGHPCFSHMFENFMHAQGCKRRQMMEANARAEGRDVLPSEEAEVRRYEEWNHEMASIRLVSALFDDLGNDMKFAGLRADAEGDDFACIRELIDPPKKELERLMAKGNLKAGWSSVIKGRPVQKAWLYEIVSNWRSGVDVDKFDYFRRDALSLGVKREFDHNRYITGARVATDPQGVPTISPPKKDKDIVRDMFELRKMLHRSAYQHKTVKKLEIHMTNILMKMDEAVRILDVHGRRLSMSEAAVKMDVRAYSKLTDTFVEAKLLDDYEDADVSPLATASREYKLHMCERNLMKTVGICDLPVDQMTCVEHIKENIMQLYLNPSGAIDLEILAVDASELHCVMVNFNYGMKHRDPISNIVWHDTKNGTTSMLPDGVDSESRPQMKKLFVFWNPSTSWESQETKKAIANELKAAFSDWQENHRKLAEELVAAPSTPTRSFGKRKLSMTPEKPRQQEDECATEGEEEELCFSSQ